MSLQHEPEQVANSELGASEETSTLLVDEQQQSVNNNNNSSNSANVARLQKAQSYTCSTNGPTTSSGITTQQSLTDVTSKPVLIRQDHTSINLTSPQLSALGTSDETSDDDNTKTISYQLIPNIPTNRCRTCRSAERRSSISPASVIYLPRSLSKESVGRLTSNPVHHHSANIPPVYVTSSPTNGSRIIRQSSQPESSTLSCCNAANCSHSHQTSSLRQIKDPSDQISGIATDFRLVKPKKYSKASIVFISSSSSKLDQWASTASIQTGECAELSRKLFRNFFQPCFTDARRRKK